jgi:hypothetical protein
MLIRLGICLTFFSWTLYNYLDHQNELTKLSIELPALEKRVILVQDEMRKMRYEIEQFENPNHLIELAHHPQFAHLKHPLLREILTVPEAMVVND